jgi:RNA polymerase sigma-70 factor (ECF subfamily)
MSQRLVRAKAKIREAGIPFVVPERNELGERLEAVLEAVYAAFSEGWSDPEGTDARRRELSGEAIWLGRLIAQHLPEEPEALGLLALMLHAEARRKARRDVDGEFVPLGEQEMMLWDSIMLEEAEQHLLAAARHGRIGRFQLEAAIQSAHANRRMTGRTDWAAIVELYDALLAITGASPVVAINRAVAISGCNGPEAGLAALRGLQESDLLKSYQPYWAATALLLTQSGDRAGAAEAYTLAAGLSNDPAAQRFLLRKRDALLN